MKDNKLIAEFMGYNYDKCIASTDKSVTLQEQGEYFIPKYNSGDWVSESELEFHESWDWLMPVLSKILDITFSDDEKETSDSEYFYNIRDCVPDINHTYKAIIEFIKTYNNGR